MPSLSSPSPSSASLQSMPSLGTPAIMRRSIVVALAGKYVPRRARTTNPPGSGTFGAPHTSLLGLRIGRVGAGSPGVQRDQAQAAARRVRAGGDDARHDAGLGSEPERVNGLDLEPGGGEARRDGGRVIGQRRTELAEPSNRGFHRGPWSSPSPDCGRGRAALPPRLSVFARNPRASTPMSRGSDARAAGGGDRATRARTAPRRHDLRIESSDRRVFVDEDVVGHVVLGLSASRCLRLELDDGLVCSRLGHERDGPGWDERPLRASRFGGTKSPRRTEVANASGSHSALHRELGPSAASELSART